MEQGKRCRFFAAIISPLVGTAFVGLAMAPVAAGAAAVSEGPEIGQAVYSKRKVTGVIADKSRRIRKGAKLHLNEVLETGRKARGEFVLNDNTKLALGPNARLVLDRFVYDPDGPQGSVTVRLAKGAFRFISGSLAKDAYKIETPSATLGIRGTVFDVYVDGNGDTAVLLHEGEVTICTRLTDCRQHRTVGRFIHLATNGIFKGPIKWDGSLFRGLSLRRAFPFVGKRLLIDPVRRFKRVDLMGGKALKAATRATREIGRTIRRVIPF